MLLIQKPVLTDLPSDVLNRIMLFTMEAEHSCYNFLDASKPFAFQNALSLALSCHQMLRIFQRSLTAVKLVNSWQSSRNTLAAASKLAAANLRALHIEYSAPVSPTLKQLVSLHPPIRHLVLIGLNISKVLISQLISSTARTLQNLVVTAAPSIDDTVVDLISFKCHNLQHLALGGSHFISSTTLIRLFQKIGHGLKALELSALEHSSLDESVIFSIAQSCVRLTCLHLLKMKWVTDIGLSCLFMQRGQQLVEFRLETCPRTTVQSLRLLSHNDTSSAKLNSIIENDAYASHHFRSSGVLAAMDDRMYYHNPYRSPSRPNVQESAASKVSFNFSSLRHLILSDITIDDEAVHNLSEACGRSLQVLSLSKCTLLGNDAMYSLARNLHTLVSLDVSFLPFLSDDALRKLVSSQSATLEKLCLMGCKSLTDTSLEQILPCYGKQLRHVEISSSWFSNQAINILKHKLPRVTVRELCCSRR